MYHASKYSRRHLKLDKSGELIMLTKESKVRCPWCQGECKAEEWDTETYKACISREMRRAFKSVTIKQVWMDTSKHYYKCPKCSMWSKGNQLKLIDEAGKVVKGYGGKPVIKTVDKGMNPML